MNEDIITEQNEIETPQEQENTAAEYEPEAQKIPENDGREALLSEINTLKEEIAALEAEREMQERTVRELREFSSLFPDTEVSALPDEVWENVKNGTSLAASYALYEVKCKREAEKIEKINSNNASRSAGRAGVGTAGEYFSPDEVRKMSPSEVHANYAKIKDSMKKWL